jgi:hypothetical protein
MALTKNVIVEQLQTQLGFPKNQSVEITNPFSKSSNHPWHPVMMSWFPASANFV